MADLNFRDVPNELIEKLRVVAVRDGVSVEEQHRRILVDALTAAVPFTATPGKSLFEHLLEMPDVGEDWMLDRHAPRNMRPDRREQLDFGREP